MSELTPPTVTWPDSPHDPLTVHGHAHGNALLKAAQLALVAGNLVDDTAAVIFAGVGGMEVLLDCAAKKALGLGGDETCCGHELPFLNQPCRSLKGGGLVREPGLLLTPQAQDHWTLPGLGTLETHVLSSSGC